jgi:IS5 family transposase
MRTKPVLPESEDLFCSRLD